MVYVALISYTPDLERTIAAAALVSTSPVGATKLMEKLIPQAVDRLLARLVVAGHLSHFEHAKHEIEAKYHDMVHIAHGAYLSVIALDTAMRRKAVVSSPLPPRLLEKGGDKA